MDAGIALQLGCIAVGIGAQVAFFGDRQFDVVAAFIFSMGMGSIGWGINELIQ